MRRFSFFASLLALAACQENPPEPATNLRLPLALEQIRRGDGRSDVFIADAEAQGVRVLQYSGGARRFLRGPAILNATTVSAPGYPTQVSAARDGTGTRLFALAPGQGILHALSVAEAEFQASFDSGRPPQVRVGTVVLRGGRDGFTEPLTDPTLQQPAPFPVVALEEVIGFGSTLLDGLSPVAMIATSERGVTSTAATSGLVDSRVLVAFADTGTLDGPGLLVAFDVRTAESGSIAPASISVLRDDLEGRNPDDPRSWLEVARARARDFVSEVFPPGVFFADPIELALANPLEIDDPETEVSPDEKRFPVIDYGVLGVRLGSIATLEVEASIRHFERLFDGSFLATDTATSSFARQYAVPDIVDPEVDIVLTASTAMGGAVHRAVAFGDQGAVVLRSDRSALVALDCRSGVCRRVRTEFATLRTFDDDVEELDVPPGVLLLRRPSAVTGVFGNRDADGEPVVLNEFRSSAQYRVFPPNRVDEPDDGVGELEGGILSLVHEDSVASFVVGQIDDLEVATLEGLFGSGDELQVPEPRVDEVFERRVMVDDGQLSSPLVLEPRTRIGGPGGCVRRDGFVTELNQVYPQTSNRPDDPSDPADSLVSAEFLGCFPDSGFEEVIPRHVKNRYELNRSPPREDECAIEADPVATDTIYRATYRGPVFRGGSDVDVEALDDETLRFELPTDLDRFDVRVGDAVDVHLRCLVPDEDDPEAFQDERIEFTVREAQVVELGRRTITVAAAETSTTVFAAPDGNEPIAAPRPKTFTECEAPAIATRLSGTTDAGTVGTADAGTAAVPDRNLGFRTLRVFDLEIYPPVGEEVGVLSREARDGRILGTFARCPVGEGADGSQQIRFDDSCQPDLPVRFSWVADDGFACRIIEGTDVPPSVRRENDIPTPTGPLDLGRPCTASAQCGGGRSCVGQSSQCPGQCEPWCGTNACFALWTVRVCDGLELQVNGARPVVSDLSTSTDGTPGAAVPFDSEYVPESRSFVHSFPGSRNLRGVRLGLTNLERVTID